MKHIERGIHRKTTHMKERIFKLNFNLTKTIGRGRGGGYQCLTPDESNLIY